MYELFTSSASEAWYEPSCTETFETLERAMKYVNDELEAWALSTEIEGFMSLSHEGKLIRFWCECRHAPGYAEASYGQNYY